MVKLKFSKGNPLKNGRYICLVESRGTSYSFKIKNTEITVINQYICFGNWIHNNQWMLDSANTIIMHNSKNEVIGWCEFEYKGK